MADRLKDKIAIVTGAGTSGPGMGNGKAAALLFAREGATVGAVDLNEQAAAQTAKAIEAENGRAIAIAGDVSNSGDVRRIVDTTVERFGRIHVLHNNVGIEILGDPVSTARTGGFFGPVAAGARVRHRVRQAFKPELVVLQLCWSPSTIRGRATYTVPVTTWAWCTGSSSAPRASNFHGSPPHFVHARARGPSRTHDALALIHHRE